MTNPNEIFLSRTQQSKRWSVSKRSVERWGEEERLALPPEIEINGRRYRKLSDLEAWERARVVATISKSAEREGEVEADKVDTPPAIRRRRQHKNTHTGGCGQASIPKHA